MRVIQRDAPGQRNTWLELVIKCSRQFRKRVTVTVCNCRTLRGFQFDRAAPRICILCVLYATRILSCNGYYEIRSRLKTLSLSLLSLSLSLVLCIPLLPSNVVINELRPFPWTSRRYEFHVSPNRSSLMDDAREICNIVPSPGFSTLVSSQRRCFFLMAEHALSLQKLRLY